MSESRRIIEAEDPKRTFNRLPRRFLYHFDLGNSTTGAVGFSAEVLAESPESAVQLLQDLLPEEISVPVGFIGSQGGITYANVYVNTRAISVDDIDSEKPA